MKHIHKSKRICKYTRFRNRVRRHEWSSWDFHHNHPTRRRLGDLYDNEKSWK